MSGMPEVEIGKVKIQPRTAGSFMVTIPNAVVKILQIKNGETMNVYVDMENKRVIYQLD